MPPDEKAKQPPVEPTATPDPLLEMLGGPSPERPTPSYFQPPQDPLPPGVVTAESPAISGSTPNSLLYLDRTLHLWHADQQTVEDLGWPDAAIDCPWLAPDHRTLYFADEAGVKSIDLTQAVTPTLVLKHYTADENPARHRRFCILGQSDSGQLLLVQARDDTWYQWGVTPLDGSVIRAVESPVGPSGEAWTCPGGALWGAGTTLLVSAYSTGPCVQFPGLYTTEWGRPLVPTPILTGTLPALGGGLPLQAGASLLTRSPDGRRVAFWFDEGWAVPEARLADQALYVVGADGSQPQRLLGPLPGQNGPPVWTADSQAVYYVTAESFDSIAPQPWQIHRVVVDTGQDTVVAEIVARRLFFVGPERDGKLSLQIVNDDLNLAFHILDLATGGLENGPAQINVIGWLN